MPNDEQHCRDRLEWHADRLSKLLQLLGGRRFVSGRDDEMVQEPNRSIRAAVRVDYERNEQKWSVRKPEQAHVQLALSDAITALQRSPSDPVGPELFDAVVKAHTAITEQLTALKRRIEHTRVKLLLVSSPIGRGGPNRCLAERRRRRTAERGVMALRTSGRYFMSSLFPKSSGPSVSGNHQATLLELSVARDEGLRGRRMACTTRGTPRGQLWKVHPKASNCYHANIPPRISNRKRATARKPTSLSMDDGLLTDF